MAKRHGKAGAIYWTPTIQAITIAFDKTASPDEITDSGSGFVTAGFKAGDLITVSGSTSNDGNYTIVSVAAGTLTLGEAVLGQDEVAGDDVTIRAALPGQLVAGFFGFTFNEAVDIVDVTDYVDGAAGFKKYITGLKDWTGEALGFWLTDDFHNWAGNEMIVRFFVGYDAAPNVTTVYYYSGRAIVSGIDTDSAVDKAVEQQIAFQGSGKAVVSGAGLALVDGGGGADTITDTGNGFIAAGFDEGQKITVSGATDSADDGTYTIVGIAAGTITLATGQFTTGEVAGNAALVVSAEVQLVLRSTAWPT